MMFILICLFSKRSCWLLWNSRKDEKELLFDKQKKMMEKSTEEEEESEGDRGIKRKSFDTLRTLTSKSQ